MAIYVKTDSGADLLSHDSNNIISDKFSESTSYSSGDYCIYNNTLYQFTADKSAGAWDSSVVEETTVANELSELNSDCQTLESGLTTANSTIKNIGVYLVFQAINASSTSGTEVSVATYTTPATGIYLFVASVYFATNASGYREVYSSRTNYAMSNIVAAASGQQTRMNYVDVMSISANTTVSIFVNQNSGSTLAVDGYFRVVRIK